jgi:hypothetical protein
MNCPDCGSVLEKGVQFCPKCNARVEPPTFWQKLIGCFRRKGNPSRPMVTIDETVSVSMTDEHGQDHEYHSLNEVPTEVREAIRRAQVEGVKPTFRSSSSDGGNARITTLGEKTVSRYKVQDETGNETGYHSLEEMPADIRAAFEEAERQNGGQPT